MKQLFNGALKTGKGRLITTIVIGTIVGGLAIVSKLNSDKNVEVVDPQESEENDGNVVDVNFTKEEVED